MMTIGEVANLTGVTIRTLRHYDRIGLLRPAQVTEAGYRLYNDAALQRLHTILLFRELEFPLESIRRMLDTPGFDWQSALEMQRTLLMMKRGHIDRLITLTQTIHEKGMTHMDFTAFDKHEAEDYARQAEAAWGQTAAWQEYAVRQQKRAPGDNERAGQEMMAMIGQFGRSRPARPDSPEAQAFVSRLQAFITEHFYTCTDDALLGLADMYETDSFRRSMDKAGGEGTASFLAAAIRCRKSTCAQKKSGV